MSYVCIYIHTYIHMYIYACMNMYCFVSGTAMSYLYICIHICICSIIRDNVVNDSFRVLDYL